MPRFLVLAFLLVCSFCLLPEVSWAQVGTQKDDGGIFGSMGMVLWNITRWAIAILAFLASFWVAGILSRMIAWRLRKRAKYELHQEVLMLVERSAYFSLIIVFGIVAFSFVGVELEWVIAPLTFGLGFAFRDLLANLVAGVVILTQKKFKIGDLIKTQNHFGRIISIDMRTTEIKNFSGINIVIPNSDMLMNSIENYTANEFRRHSVLVGVHYSTPLPYAVETTQKALAKHDLILAEPGPEVIAKEFGESSILLEVRFWIESDHRWWQIRSDLISAIKTEYDQAGITIPFPIRTLTLDPYDKNLLETANVSTQYKGPSYTGYTQEEMQAGASYVPTEQNPDRGTNPVITQATVTAQAQPVTPVPQPQAQTAPQIETPVVSPSPAPTATVPESKSPSPVPQV